MNLYNVLKQSTIFSFVAVLASIIPIGMVVYQQYIGEYSVIVASSPATAEIYLNERSVGKTPLTLKLKKGSYTLGAKRMGYEPLEHAIYVDPKDKNIVNIQLLPSPLVSKPVQTGSQLSKTTNPEIQKVYKEIQKLKSIIVLDPEHAATIPILTEKVLFQEKAINALRDELKDVRGAGKVVFGFHDCNYSWLIRCNRNTIHC